MVVFIFQ